MENLEIYNNNRAVPIEAQKEILGGRLKGKTDINPMWRIKALTAQFGICGVGWWPEIKRFWIEEGFNNEKSAFCEIALYVKVNGEWSKGIPGIGGSNYVIKEANGFYTNDECYKMAYTDAISVACKALGFGADIYWRADKSKYDLPNLKTTTTTRTNKQILIDIAKTNPSEAEHIKDILLKEFEGKTGKDLTEEEATSILKRI